MKTDELIQLLASDAAAVPQRVWRGRYAAALGIGAAGAAALMLTLLGLRPDMAEAWKLPMFWVKLVFPLALMTAALLAVSRLARPGVPLGRVPAGLLAPVAVMWLLAAVSLVNAPPDERAALLLGETWKTCPGYITLLSVPVFAAAFWVMKTLAPTRLALAGAASGLLGGTLGASIYALHCPEMGAPFLGVWYVLGMLIPAAAGALLGPRLLRW